MEKNNVNKNATYEFNVVEALVYELRAGSPLIIGCGNSLYIGNEQYGKTVRMGLIKVLDEYQEELECREFNEVRKAVNTLIDHCEDYCAQHIECDGCVECNNCAIYEFCNKAMQEDTLAKLPKYKVDKEG